MVQMLGEAGYNQSEIWAVSYLGRQLLGDGNVDNPNAFSNNVNDFRKWIEEVMDYLDVDEVDIIAHSLGCTLARSWIEGYSSAQIFSAARQRDNR